MRKFGLLALTVFATLSFSQAAKAAQIDLFFDQQPSLTDYAVTAHADMNWFAVGFGVSGGTSIVFDTDIDTAASISFLSAGNLYASATGGVAVGTIPASTTVDLGIISVGSPLQGGTPGMFGPQDILVSTLDVFYDASASGAFGANPGLDPSGGGLAVTVKITNIPEPTTMVLLGAGLAGLAFLRRRTA